MAKLSPEAQAAMDEIIVAWTRNWETKANWLRVQLAYTEHEVKRIAEEQKGNTLERVKE